jgi:GT2 family glycosyltransferase
LATPDSHAQLHISVIVPAFQAWETLPKVLEALASQVQRPDREAIVIVSSADGRAEELAEQFPWATVVAFSERLLPGRARNHGTGLAKGDLVAFIDSDAIPSEHWLDELERSMSRAVDAVTSPVLNGTPWHPVGTSGYLLEFVEWLPGRRRPPRHGATCSLLVRRLYLEEVGGFLEDIFPGEDTILTYPMAQKGRLGYAPRANVSHLNRTSLSSFLQHQVRLGTSFVALCDKLDFPHSVVTRAWAIPFAPLLRLVALGLAVRRNPREALQVVLYLPVIVLGLLFWTRGLIKGRRGSRD